MRCSTERTCNIFPSLLTFILPTYGPTPKLAQHKPPLEPAYVSMRLTISPTLPVSVLYVKRKFQNSVFIFLPMFAILPAFTLNVNSQNPHFSVFFLFLPTFVFYLFLYKMSIGKSQNLFFCFVVLLTRFCHLPISPH